MYFIDRFIVINMNEMIVSDQSEQELSFIIIT